MERKTRLFTGAFILFSVAVFSGLAAWFFLISKPKAPHYRPVKPTYSKDWTLFEPEGRPIGDSQTTLTTLAAYPPVEGTEYETFYPGIMDAGARKKDLRHFFSMEKTVFHSGEPILLKFRIEVDSPGEWKEIPFNNFSDFGFLVRKDKEPWLLDNRRKYMWSHGMYAPRTLSRDEPGERECNLLERFDLDEPGTYTLYCFFERYIATGLWEDNGSPLYAGMPAEVRQYCQEFYAIDPEEFFKAMPGPDAWSGVYCERRTLVHQIVFASAYTQVNFKIVAP